MLPLEVSILVCAITLARSGTNEFHGFELAKRLRDGDGSRQLTAHGRLYKALSRMEKAGWLSSLWEEADAATSEGRPRRRLYSITSEGRAALAAAEAQAATTERPDLGWSPS